MIGNQVVTFSLFRFENLQNRWWAFRQMGLSPWLLRSVSGMQFGKMLGSGGGNGFNIQPNWNVYGFLGVWEDATSAQQFFSHHPFFAQTHQHAAECWTVFLRAFMSHGQWNGQAPFYLYEHPGENEPIAVLTRATIRKRHLLQFWKFVPPVSQVIENQAGLLFSIGIGELPIVQQATFSLWENAHFMKAYAYQSPHHSAVIKKTRELGWYKEELFARFVPFASEGTWGGKNPLEPFLKQKIRE